MPSQPNDPHIANNPLPEDSDDNEPDEPLLDLNDINKMDITTLRYMLIKLIIRERAASAIYKKPSRRPNFYEELSWTNDEVRPQIRPHLCTILRRSTKSTGADNVNYLFLRPAKAEPWRLHELYNHLKNYLTKMVYIAE
ncbi:uncharacterized protein UBRO_05918 [Ustilago bromivora]|uniref:Uncharacterized protein n=1 Tax=Ustilago bromivora TaxID=307758 RepID=A0A1K0HJ16_9BASI|nr:uncharacterized protein UBRO_05918 [Ustilago bromivora]